MNDVMQKEQTEKSLAKPKQSLTSKRDKDRQMVHGILYQEQV